MLLSDTFKLSENTVSDTIAAYVEAKAWLESLGINVNPSRFNLYRKKIESAAEASSLKEAFQILWMHAELHDLSEIRCHLVHVKSPSFLANLKLAVKGPLLLDDESVNASANKGRNYTFELFVAARLARAGLPVCFDTIADINFRFESRLYHVECKRVFEERKFDSLIIEAMNQIEKRCSEYAGSKGIVAISISKFVHKAVGLAAHSVYADLKEMQDLMRVFVGRTGLRLQHHFSTQSKNTVGILLHYKIPFIDVETGAITFLSRFSMTQLENGLDNNLLAHEISRRLGLSVA